MPLLNGRRRPFSHQTASAGLLLLVLLLGAYAPSFVGGWHYDDHPNILDNPNVHLETIDGSALQRTFCWQADHPGARCRIQRPLAYFSFALNWYVGQNRTIGYHVVNFVIHYITAVVLYLVCRQVAALPWIGGRHASLAHPAACLAAIVWAVHPIQVTAVTYIVQRMASMAGMFTIICIYAYLQARLTEGGPWQIRCRFGAAAICALLAVGTKENAALLPISILLLEMLIIRKHRSAGAGRRSIQVAVAVAMVGMVGLIITDPSALFNGYEHRPYTPFERVLTEPRVMLLYLKWLFYPLLSAFTLVHDIHISTAWWSPWTTGPSMLTIAIMAGGSAWWLAGRQPLAAFGMLFFLIHHSIEASFIPLELIYEHRNYIPSMFVFLAPAMWIVRGFHYFAYDRRYQRLMIISGAMVLASVVHTTFVYNQKFATDLSLWRDNAAKAPGLSVVHNNYGVALMRHGMTEQAVSSFNRAIRLDRYFNLTQRGLAHYNLGWYFETVAGDDVTALSCYREAIRRSYSSKRMGSALATSQLRNGDWAGAATTIEQGLDQWPDDPAFLTALAFLQMMRGQWMPALETTHRIRRVAPLAVEPLGLYGDIFRHVGQPHKAIFFWTLYAQRSGRQWVADLALVDLFDQTDQPRRRRTSARRLAASPDFRKWQLQRESNKVPALVTELMTPELQAR